ncbi:hypothetical protein X975_21491, partial [Stegodyphus mimosarum]
MLTSKVLDSRETIRAELPNDPEFEREPEFKQANIQKLIDEALKNSDVARERQRLYDDKKRRESDFKVGDKVLKSKFTLYSAPENVVSKFARKFEGPHNRSQQIVGAVIYLKTESGERMKATLDQLKKYYERKDFDVLHDLFQASEPEETASPVTILTHRNFHHLRKSKQLKKLQVRKSAEEFQRKESLNVWKI